MREGERTFVIRDQSIVLPSIISWIILWPEFSIIIVLFGRPECVAKWVSVQQLFQKINTSRRVRKSKLKATLHLCPVRNLELPVENNLRFIWRYDENVNMRLD